MNRGTLKTKINARIDALLKENKLSREGRAPIYVGFHSSRDFEVYIDHAIRFGAESAQEYGPQEIRAMIDFNNTDISHTHRGQPRRALLILNSVLAEITQGLETPPPQTNAPPITEAPPTTKAPSPTKKTKGSKVALPHPSQFYLYPKKAGEQMREAWAGVNTTADSFQENFMEHNLGCTPTDLLQALPEDYEKAMKKVSLTASGSGKAGEMYDALNAVDAVYYAAWQNRARKEAKDRPKG